MTSFIVVGTDTNAGKTTFSARFLQAFPEYTYWKPVETGDSDTDKIAQLGLKTHPPLARFKTPVAPALAATTEGKTMPGIEDVIERVPIDPILIETFGSPLSPWDDDHLQLELIQRYILPIVLVSPSTVGAIGRTLQCITSLHVKPAVVVLLGERDDYAVSQIERHSGVRVVSVPWEGENGQELQEIHRILNSPSPPEPLSHQWRVGDRIWHPYTSLSDPIAPLPVVGMRDEFLQLADGLKIVDAISSWWTIQHGHRHPRLVKALKDATDKYDHVIFAGATHPPAEELAELLLATTGWEAGRVFYSDNGSTAVEVALKMAYQYWCLMRQPQRKTFICFEHGYHGDTFGAMAVGRDPTFFGRFEPFLFKAIQIPIQVATLRETLESQAHEIAAVIIEPLVQGAGGMRMHTPAELSEIATLCRQYDVLLIIDEVMTGGGRTGKYWAHQHARIEPDLICAGKTIAGGMMPLATTLVSQFIVDEFMQAERKDTFFHGHSFTAHPLACAVGVENLKIMNEGHWHDDVDRIEAFWEEHLSDLTKHPNVEDVRICGIIAAVELRDSKGYLSELGPRIRQKALEMGIMLRPLGTSCMRCHRSARVKHRLVKIAEAIKACVNLPD